MRLHGGQDKRTAGTADSTLIAPEQQKGAGDTPTPLVGFAVGTSSGDGGAPFAPVVLDDPELRRDIESQREWRRHWERGAEDDPLGLVVASVGGGSSNSSSLESHHLYDTLSPHRGRAGARGGCGARSGFGGGCAGSDQWPVTHNAALLAQAEMTEERAAAVVASARDTAVVEEAAGRLRALRLARCSEAAAARARGDTEAAMAAASAGPRRRTTPR